ncbi:MAG: cytochrome P450 [Gammaproteobacteria bacterium]
MDANLLAQRPANVPADRVIDFDLYQPPGVERGFHEAWQKLHAPGVPDLIWTPRNGGHWMATRGKMIAEVFGDYARFSCRVYLVPKAVGEQHQMLPVILDPPEHRPYRLLLNTSLAPKIVIGMEDRIRQLACALIERFRTEGQCNFTQDYAEVLPVQIFMSMVDLPQTDVAKIKYWSDQIVHPDGSMSYRDAKQHIYDYLDPYIDARFGGDGQDMLSRIINGKVNDRALTKPEMLSLCMQMLLGGLDTVVNFLGFVLLFLARNPGHRHELTADPGLIPAAVEEFLRRFPVVSLAREVRDDIEYDGVQLKKGEMVAIPTPLAGTDARLNAEPLNVDFRRPSAAHVTFGNGPHVCPGALLARTEIRITLEEWLARIPEFAVAPAAEIRFRGGLVGVVDALPLVWDVATTRAGTPA